MNIPNFLTVLRIVLVPIIVILLIQATSVPGFCRRNRVEYFASGISRGSMTMSFAPRLRTARLTYIPMMGWFSVVLVPVARITSANSISSIALVIAPLPKEAASPATVELCQRRAQ